MTANFYILEYFLFIITSDESGSKIFDPGQVGSIFCGSGRVSHFWFRFEFGKFPLKTSNFSIFSLWVKKISSGCIREYPGQRWVSLLFTTGQSKLGSGQGPSLIITLYLQQKLMIFTCL